MKKILLIAIMGLSVSAYAQSDDPCGATSLTVGTSCSLTPGSNAGFTNSAVASPSCGSYTNRDGWYAITAPASGQLIIQTNSGTITDLAMALYSGSCSTPTEVTCDDDSGPGLMPQMSLTGLTAGAVYYLRIWQYGGGAGTFSICAWDPASVATGGGDNNDCMYATQLCSTESFDDNVAGTGTVNDLNGSNHGCLVTNEHQPAWYIFQFSTGGTFQLTINPNTNSDDFDFGVWGPNPTCPPSTDPLRCSYSALTNNTGVNSTNNLPEVDATENALGNKWVVDMNVLATEIYVLMVDNFTSDNNGFEISFGGTAVIDCTPILPITLVNFSGVNEVDHNVMTWTTQSEINNDHFEMERSENGEQFVAIGTVNGAGNSFTQQNYQFIDFSPHLGNNYYRLKQVDYNGAIHFSPTILIMYEGSSSAWVYPNPAENNLINIAHREQKGSDFGMSVSNAIGQVVYSYSAISDGEFHVEKINLPAKGIFWVAMKSGEKISVQKVVN